MFPELKNAKKTSTPAASSRSPAIFEQDKAPQTRQSTVHRRFAKFTNANLNKIRRTHGIGFAADWRGHPSSKNSYRGIKICLLKLIL
jgi:hypothetical protein